MHIRNMAKSFIDEIDPEIEDMKLNYHRYEVMRDTGLCPKCGQKQCETYEVTSSRDPADCDIDGVRANCRNCQLEVCLDF